MTTAGVFSSNHMKAHRQSVGLVCFVSVFSDETLESRISKALLKPVDKHFLDEFHI